MSTKVFYVTNRPRLGAGYGAALSTTPNASADVPLRYGTINVEPSAVPGIPGRLLGVANEAGSDDANAVAPSGSLPAFLMQFFSEAKNAGATPLLYIHGFDFSFADATVWTGDIAAFYAADPALPTLWPMVFSWPSLGQVTSGAYSADRVAASASGHALARLILALARAWASADKPVVHLLAHSMGVTVLDSGLRMLDGSGQVLPSALFAQSVVVAGDDDCSAFSAGGGLRPLMDLARWVTVGINRSDVVTGIDQDLVLHRPRLANDGPDDFTQLASNVYVVDYTAAAGVHGVTPSGETDWDFWTHNYYHTVPRVRADLAQVFCNVAPRDVTGRIPWQAHPQLPSHINAAQWAYVMPHPETLEAWLTASLNHPISNMA